MSKLIVTDEFENTVLKGDKPAVVDFYADWCGPCKMLAPVFEKLEEDAGGKYDFYKINIDHDAGLAANYGVMSIPTLIFFKDGREADRVVGLVSGGDILKRLEAL